MDLIFKKATTVDIPLICSLADKIWREHYPSIITMEQIDYMLQTRYSAPVIAEGMNRGEQYFIAYAGKEPMAYASIEVQAGVYFLHKFYVDVSHHRKGVGEKFFNFLLSHIPPTFPVKLQVNRQNFKAINFYFKLGFVIESTGDFDIGNGYYMNDFVMVLEVRREIV